jgi:hypothetical protein
MSLPIVESKTLLMGVSLKVKCSRPLRAPNAVHIKKGLTGGIQ